MGVSDPHFLGPLRTCTYPDSFFIGRLLGRSFSPAGQEGFVRLPQRGASTSGLPIMGNPVSKSQEFMEQRERTNTEHRKQGTLSMNLVSLLFFASPLFPKKTALCTVGARSGDDTGRSPQPMKCKGRGEG